MDISTHAQLLLTVVFTSICWIVTAYVAPQTDRSTLINFYKKVRPFGPGWAAVRQEAGFSAQDATKGQNITLSLIGWVAGCSMVWSSLFTVGNFLYGRMGYAVILCIVFVISGSAVIWVINRLWQRQDAQDAQDLAEGR